MLDLIISYIEFLFVTLRTIVKLVAFRPPKPQGYLTEKGPDNSQYEKIKFLRTKPTIKYEYISIRNLNYDYMQISDPRFGYVPILIFTPKINSCEICIIYSHGNSGDLGTCLFECYDIATHTNCVLISYEYPGYGNSKNVKTTEEHVYDFIQLVYKFAKETLGFPSDKIILYGFSLGTGVSFDLACRDNCAVAGLILQAPFLSILRTIYDFRTTHFNDFFNNCDKAKFLKCKTLFLHGNQDKIVPYIHGRILASLIPKDKLYKFYTIKDADHNNAFKKYRDEIYNEINKFIKDMTGIDQLHKEESGFIRNEIEEQERMARLLDPQFLSNLFGNVNELNDIRNNKTTEFRPKSLISMKANNNEPNNGASSKRDFNNKLNESTRNNKSENVNLNNIKIEVDLNKFKHINVTNSEIERNFDNGNYTDKTELVKLNDINIETSDFRDIKNGITKEKITSENQIKTSTQKTETFKTDMCPEMNKVYNLNNLKVFDPNKDNNEANKTYTNCKTINNITTKYMENKENLTYDQNIVNDGGVSQSGGT